MRQKIDYVIDPLIQFNKDWASKNSHQRENMTAIHFAKEFQTLKFDIGRQCGKTWYIARTVGLDDLIVCRTLDALNEMSRRVFAYNVKDVPRMLCNSKLDNVSDRYSTVWVDDATHVKADDMANIYTTFAGICDQFILIG